MHNHLRNLAYRPRSKQWRRHGFEGGGKQIFCPPLFVYLGDMKQNMARFIIVIMTSKRLPAANEIT